MNRNSDYSIFKEGVTVNTNKIKNQLMRVKQSLIALFFLLTLSLNFACVDSPDNMQVISDNPFGVGIIVFNSVPSQIFGNGCEIDTIKLNTGLIADGSTIDVIVTNTGSLESEAGGCVVGSSATVVNDMAT
ncbi:MAG: hypothetical protein GWN56_07265, partial [Nitrosopumilaceae archaeon]|nr:hypothetical protein [Nitrosopumilaceae archaeon]